MFASVIMFTIAIVGGVGMAILRFKGRRVPPLSVAIFHGSFALMGLFTLLTAVLDGQVHGLSLASLALFIVTACGGFFLFSFHLRGKALPKPLIILHGITALSSYSLLVVAIVARLIHA